MNRDRDEFSFTYLTDIAHFLISSRARLQLHMLVRVALDQTMTCTYKV